MPNYDSFYKNLANKTVDWLPMDTEELYKKNLDKRHGDLVLQGWIDNHFTYEFNSHGFRCKEFTDKPSIMFLGCSFTMGMGLPVDLIWPELVSKNLNLQCVNLGIAGSSADTAFRLCHGWLDKINPNTVIFMQPPGIRCELVTDDSIKNVDIEDPSTKEFIKLWTVDENNNYFNTEKNTLGIQMLCTAKGIKFVTVNANTLTSSYSNSFGRDLCHPGIDRHRVFAERLSMKLGAGRENRTLN